MSKQAAYSVKQLADLAGTSVRTLHYYDEMGLLKPSSHGSNGYRYYDEDAALRLQQIMFFRELGFSLDEIRNIVSRLDFNVLEALQSHRVMLTKKAERIRELTATVDKTIKKLRGEIDMEIKDYYQGLSDDQIKEYRKEARERWGEDVVGASEARLVKMGKAKASALQAEGGVIFKAIADNMGKGPESPEVQELVVKWRNWLENFSHYSDEAVLGLGQMYSQDPRFAKFFQKYHKNLPQFFTKAVEYYCSKRTK